MNNKYFILLTLTLIILLPTCSKAFSDVEGHWAEEVINKASSQGIIKGYYDNTFHPNEYMTRAELVTVINNLLDLESETDKYIQDITSKDWYYSNMRKAVYFGIIVGDNKGNVHPDDDVTREEAIVIISRAFRLDAEDALFNSSFADASKISSWAKKDVISLVRKQIIKGYEDNTIRPKKSITRAEILTIIYRIIKNSSMSTYSSKITGDTIIRDRTIELHNVEIFGNLIIGEKAAKTIKLKNVIVNGNLIAYAPIDEKANTIAISGKLVNAYEDKLVSNTYYINEEYGITFPIPDSANVYNGMPENSNEYTKKDIIVVNVDVNDDYYYQNIKDISQEVIKSIGYDSIFSKVTQGEIQKNPYELYKDNANSTLLVVKRDNIIYSILFLNIKSSNIIDNVISNMVFSNGTKIKNHDNIIYRNSKLALKFNYKNGYVGVDDSYNTNNVYSGDAIFKLFIQVNMITDMDEYSVEQLKDMLKTFVKNDGKLLSDKIKKINNHDSIEFEIENDDDKIISTYIIIGKNLYNFIFKGSKSHIDSIGKDMFHSILNSMEF